MDCPYAASTKRLIFVRLKNAFLVQDEYLDLLFLWYFFALEMLINRFDGLLPHLLGLLDHIGF